MYPRRVAVLTVRTKDPVSSLRSCAASALLALDWDTSTPSMRYSTLIPGAHTTLRLSGSLPLSGVPLSLTVYTILYLLNAIEALFQMSYSPT